MSKIIAEKLLTPFLLSGVKVSELTYNHEAIKNALGCVNENEFIGNKTKQGKVVILSEYVEKQIIAKIKATFPKDRTLKETYREVTANGSVWNEILVYLHFADIQVIERPKCYLVQNVPTIHFVSVNFETGKNRLEIASISDLEGNKKIAYDNAKSYQSNVDYFLKVLIWGN